MIEHPILCRTHIDGAWRYSTLQLTDDALHVLPEFNVPKKPWLGTLLTAALMANTAAWVADGTPMTRTVSMYSGDGIGPVSLIMIPLLLIGGALTMWRDHSNERKAVARLSEAGHGGLSLRLAANLQSRSFDLTHQAEPGLKVVRRWGSRLVLQSSLGDRLVLKGLSLKDRDDLADAINAAQAA